MIGRNGERRSGISAQTARHDDDDDYCWNNSISNSTQVKQGGVGVQFSI